MGHFEIVHLLFYSLSYCWQSWLWLLFLRNSNCCKLCDQWRSSFSFVFGSPSAFSWQPAQLLFPNSGHKQPWPFGCHASNDQVLVVLLEWWSPFQRCAFREATAYRNLAWCQTRRLIYLGCGAPSNSSRCCCSMVEAGFSLVAWRLAKNRCVTWAKRSFCLKFAYRNICDRLKKDWRVFYRF